VTVVEYSELPILFAYIAAVRCILFGLLYSMLLVLFLGPYAANISSTIILASIFGAIISGAIEYIATCVVVYDIMRKA